MDFAYVITEERYKHKTTSVLLYVRVRYNRGNEPKVDCQYAISVDVITVEILQRKRRNFAKSALAKFLLFLCKISTVITYRDVILKE